MRIIFIRHPETLANVGGLIYGRSESEYSEKGRMSFDWIIKHLRDRSIDGIFASPLQRTALLAGAIGSEYDIPAKFCEELIEMDFGLFEYLTPEQAAERHEVQYQAFMENYADYSIPDGESFRDVYKRVSGFIKDVLKEEGTYVIVTHGMVMKAAIAFLLNINLEDVWHFSTKPGAILEIEYRDAYGVLHELTGPDID